MDINRTSGKRVSVSQRGFVTAQSNQATVRKPWKSLAAVAFGLFLSVPGLTQAQYRFTTIDVPGATRTAANGNSTHQVVGDFDDAGGTHGFVLNNDHGVFTTIDFTTIDVPGAKSTSLNGINAAGQLAGTYNVVEGAPRLTPFSITTAFSPRSTLQVRSIRKAVSSTRKAKWLESTGQTKLVASSGATAPSPH
jgi:hypothetical protein